VVTGRLLAAGCLVGAAALVATAPRDARRRLRSLHPAPARPRLALSALPARAVAALCAVSVAVLLDGWLGVALAVPVGLAVDSVLRRVEPRAARAERLRAAADLPLAADLLSAALRAGAPLDRAAGAVGTALGGPLGDRLLRVSRSLRLGATAQEAWRHLRELSSARAEDPAGFDRPAVAAARSTISGAALAGVLGRLAEELRASRAAAAEAAMRRAGVLVVLPLGLCFLPAFVLAGLVPVIVAVLGDVM